MLIFLNVHEINLVTGGQLFKPNPIDIYEHYIANRNDLSKEQRKQDISNYVYGSFICLGGITLVILSLFSLYKRIL
jgi:hypothetical protein